MSVRTLSAKAMSAPVEDQPPLLLRQPAAWRFLGLSRTAFFRFKALGMIPRPVSLPGCDPLYRRADLEKFVERLKSAR
jgi:predicted DNA-binding transcriptional regulator AlpA